LRKPERPNSAEIATGKKEKTENRLKLNKGGGKTLPGASPERG